METRRSVLALWGVQGSRGEKPTSLSRSGGRLRSLPRWNEELWELRQGRGMAEVVSNQLGTVETPAAPWKKKKNLIWDI